ncbi:MAG: matrixin family metalloprotease [Proteobacteria bacterium]|nr:matrixin family metalloprotease [Pseudomonadota bacterium]
MPGAALPVRITAGLLALGLAACTAPLQSLPEAAYEPTRRDYTAFRGAYPDLIEPNYLPFMVHRFRGSDARGDALVLCRWPDSAMPLRIFVEPPRIRADLQNEFRPILPSEYTEAVRAAFAVWENNLEGLVTFRFVESGEEADLRVNLVGHEHAVPELEVQVLGSVRMTGSCRATRWDPDAERLDVAFRVDELRIFVADEVGLLTPTQVERVARHEIGHALGMRGHSPIPADLMYEVGVETIYGRGFLEGLSQQDVNSFLTLYRLPNGTHFGWVPPGPPGERPPPASPPRHVEFSAAPYVDARHGFELFPPAGWLTLQTDHGVVMVDGTTWDHEVSFQVVVVPFPDVESYLERYAGVHFRGRFLRYRAPLVVEGRPGLQVWLDDGARRRAETLTWVELGQGRLMVLIAESPLETAPEWRQWFHVLLGRIELWPSVSGRR